ncbi:hypothetical protein Thiowin_01417 [Thiorhodovibrio winogradskyi]|uniref:Uncharacterized protein n=1 Tax=Thiorhodovibrio winogradskyi TaxID=77007 RepID=A0ABZ0S630_9GAMM
MFMKDTPSDKLVEVLGLRDLFNPLHPQVIGRFLRRRGSTGSGALQLRNPVFSLRRALPALLVRFP